MSDLAKELEVMAANITTMADSYLVSRLRKSAALIESQDERIKALEAGLKPFADEMEKRAFKTHPHWPDGQSFIGFKFTLGDLRRAASLLEVKL